jgi:hypothetical protein
MARTLTLLDLVTAVQDVTRSEAEAIATIVDLVNSGRVRLGGKFAGAQFEVSPVSAQPVAA